MTKRNTTPGEKIGTQHQTEKPTVSELEQVEPQEYYDAETFALALLQQLYPGFSITSASIHVHHHDHVDYKTYLQERKERDSFGEVHVLASGEELSKGDLLGSLVTVTPQEADRDSFVHQYLQKVAEDMVGYYPAGLRALFEITENQEKYINNTTTMFNVKGGILFPGIQFCTPLGVWSMPLVKLKKGLGLTVELVEVTDRIKERVTLFLST